MITIYKRNYTVEQLKKLLSTVGWTDDVNAFIGSLFGDEVFGTLDVFKKQFRNYRTHQRLLISPKIVEVIAPEIKSKTPTLKSIPCTKKARRAVPLLGGINKSLLCSNNDCSKLRYANSPLCPDCYGKSTDKGTRNAKGNIIQAKLPRDLWLATQFASSMVRDKTHAYHLAVKIAAKYYKVNREDVQSAMSQRSGLNKKK